MTSRNSKSSQGNLYLALIAVVVLAIAVILLLINSAGSLLGNLIRLFALTGYLLMFLAIVSTAYIRQMLKLFGRPFLRVHHYASIGSLVLVTLHPLSVAIQSSSLSVFVPNLSSVYSFFQRGGSVAWYLVVIATIAVILRQSLKQQWRTIHMLTYVTFWFATIHAILLGSNLQNVVMRVTAVFLALIVLAISIQKRQQAQRRRPAVKSR